jgi:hypothetical protein
MQKLKQAEAEIAKSTLPETWTEDKVILDSISHALVNIKGDIELPELSIDIDIASNLKKYALIITGLEDVTLSFIEYLYQKFSPRLFGIEFNYKGEMILYITYSGSDETNLAHVYRSTEQKKPSIFKRAKRLFFM